ncbi:hypothetical protein V8E36_007789, partial [Tilletia maclaganii]
DCLGAPPLVANCPNGCYIPRRTTRPHLPTPAAARTSPTASAHRHSWSSPTALVPLVSPPLCSVPPPRQQPRRCSRLRLHPRRLDPSDAHLSRRLGRRLGRIAGRSLPLVVPLGSGLALWRPAPLHLASGPCLIPSAGAHADHSGPAPRRLHLSLITLIRSRAPHHCHAVKSHGQDRVTQVRTFTQLLRLYCSLPAGWLYLQHTFT